jgi:hypothetical protein
MIDLDPLLLPEPRVAFSGRVGRTRMGGSSGVAILSGQTQGFLLTPQT